MNNLKKALGKEDIKKYSVSNNSNKNKNKTIGIGYHGRYNQPYQNIYEQNSNQGNNYHPTQQLQDHYKGYNTTTSFLNKNKNLSLITTSTAFQKNKKNNLNNYQQNNTSGSNIAINDLIQCRNTLKKNVQMSIQKYFALMIEDTFQVQKQEKLEGKLEQFQRSINEQERGKEGKKVEQSKITNILSISIQKLLEKMVQKYAEICFLGRQQRQEISISGFKQKNSSNYQQTLFDKRLEAVFSILQRMHEDLTFQITFPSNSNINSSKTKYDKEMLKNLETCLKQCEKLLKEARRRQKQKALKDYQQMIKILNPSGASSGSPKKKQKAKFGEQQEQNKQKQSEQKTKKTLKNCLSGKNLKIKFTLQEYQLKDKNQQTQKQKDDQQEHITNQLKLKKQKSQGNIFQALINKNHKNHKIKKQSQGYQQIDKISQEAKTIQDYKAKLYSLLKQPPIGVKILKKKVEYELQCDYSAILEASKAKIKQRNNRTMMNQQKQKQYKTKVHNKGKKNDAFIFYRPNAK